MDRDQKFLCDEMLAGLGKWLRAAGYDTLIAAPGSSDRSLLITAMHENRLLITRDRSFTQRKEAHGRIVLLNENGLENWVRSLRHNPGIDWHYNPFSRCLRCNQPLVEGPGSYGGQMPDYVLAENIPCFHCPACAKSYWAGGHVQRMRKRLDAWQKG